MIRINKAEAAIPAILDSGGAGDTETNYLKANFDAGDFEFVFKSHIYGHEDVKKTLVEIQHGKCCFCEARVDHTSHGDVEHFRPKGGYQVSEGLPLIKPGYYWLAYDFNNLFFACEKCNQSYKKNYFPLDDESKRAKSHHDDYTQEYSLIIHPELDDPEQHITFASEVVKPLDGSMKGEETIRRTGLDRKKLEDERLDYIKILKPLAVLAKSDLPEAEEAKSLFKELGLAKSIYSSMVRANFKDLVI
ncbi:hypothetical protein [Spirosoma oryzicola]|uniref:hypothetical protein n=1 Tax=Spirosoma oryzicola TaxID=2898794 RepID=UPI001E5B91DD|nr:hypothetical protein [Spirosoma oryzicola]UHG90134.1 hypothetical protein LQ777_18000 [Spirosoma oryzicola]